MRAERRSGRERSGRAPRVGASSASARSGRGGTVLPSLESASVPEELYRGGGGIHDQQRDMTEDDLRSRAMDGAFLSAGTRWEDENQAMTSSGGPRAFCFAAGTPANRHGRRPSASVSPRGHQIPASRRNYRAPVADVFASGGRTRACAARRASLRRARLRPQLCMHPHGSGGCAGLRVRRPHSRGMSGRLSSPGRSAPGRHRPSRSFTHRAASSLSSAVKHRR